MELYFTCVYVYLFIVITIIIIFCFVLLLPLLLSFLLSFVQLLLTLILFTSCTIEHSKHSLLLLSSTNFLQASRTLQNMLFFAKSSPMKLALPRNVIFRVIPRCNFLLLLLALLSLTSLYFPLSHYHHLRSPVHLLP